MLGVGSDAACTWASPALLLVPCGVQARHSHSQVLTPLLWLREDSVSLAGLLEQGGGCSSHTAQEVARVRSALRAGCVEELGCSQTRSVRCFQQGQSSRVRRQGFWLRRLTLRWVLLCLICSGRRGPEPSLGPFAVKRLAFELEIGCPGGGLVQLCCRIGRSAVGLCDRETAPA